MKLELGNSNQYLTPYQVKTVKLADKLGLYVSEVTGGFFIRIDCNDEFLFMSPRIEEIFAFLFGFEACSGRINPINPVTGKPCNLNISL